MNTDSATLRTKAVIRELEIRELERKKEKGRLYSLRTSVLLQFQILFDGVEKSMNSSNRKISLDERVAHLV